MVKRYIVAPALEMIEDNDVRATTDTVECEYGEWVHYEDYAELHAKLERAQAALRDVLDDLGDSVDWLKHDHAQALNEARKDGE